MKLYSVVLTAILLCILSVTLRNAVFYAGIYESKSRELFLSYTAKKFISQSFKNTCSGKGFESLEQWRLVCSALFTLEEISYETAANQSLLMHAVWIGSSEYEKCSGEVFYRIENEGVGDSDL